MKQSVNDDKSRSFAQLRHAVIWAWVQPQCHVRVYVEGMFIRTFEAVTELQIKALQDVRSYIMLLYLEHVHIIVCKYKLDMTTILSPMNTISSQCEHHDIPLHAAPVQAVHTCVWSGMPEVSNKLAGAYSTLYVYVCMHICRCMVYPLHVNVLC